LKTIIVALVFMYLHISYSQWESVNLGVPDDVSKIEFVDDNTGFLVSRTTLLKTTNQGVNWVFIPVPSVGAMLDVSFPNQGTGYICANSGGRFLKTTDGGNNWSLMYTNIPNFGQYSIDFNNANTGFIAGGWGNPSSTSIIKTTNGGLTWTVQLLSAAFFHQVKMINNQEVIACGDKVFRTNNGGVSWNEIAFTHTFNFYDVYFNNNIGYMVSEGTSIGFPSVYRSSNYGVTWEATQLTGGERLLGVHFLNESYGFVCGFGGIYRTSNNGQNWTRDTITTLMRSIGGNSSYLFAGGFQGSIYRTTNPIGIVQISAVVPEVFSLSQNYPNPFNPTTQIEFTVAKNEFVKITVFDVTGRVMEKLVNEDLNTGTYKVDFNADSYSSGIYFYRLETDGYSETKKMVLLK